MSVCVLRPCVDIMDEEFFDDEEEFPDLPSDEEDDDIELPSYTTPRVSLGDMFERLSGEKASPPRSGRPSFGWTHEDLGGDGICIGDCFANVSEGLQKLSAPCTNKVEADLGTIQWDGLQTMNPNKIFCIVIEYIVNRWPKVAVGRRHKDGKQQPWRYELAKLAKDPMRDLKIPLQWRTRSDGYYAMTAWISRLSGRSVRVVRNEMNEEWIKKGKWKSMEEIVKCRFHFLKMLEKEDLFQDSFPELFERRPNGRSSQTSFADVGTRAKEPLPVTQCYGWLASYNTDLGLQDPEIMQWVQQGLRDDELAAKLKQHILIQKAFSRFVSFHRDLAHKHDFKTWAVGLEHSRHAKHPARVHLHTYAGVDIRGGSILMGVPLARPVSKSGLTFPGCDVPFVKFTIIRRPSSSTILNGVSTGMYYVCGSKESSLMVEASMLPIQERRT